MRWWQFRRKTKRKQTADSGGNRGGMWHPSHGDEAPSQLPRCQTEDRDRHYGTASLLCLTIKRKIIAFSSAAFQLRTLKDVHNFLLQFLGSSVSSGEHGGCITPGGFCSHHLKLLIFPFSVCVLLH